MKLKRAMMVMLCLAPAPVAAQHGPQPVAPARTYSTSAVGAQGATAWREDLRQVIAAIEREHPAPYNRTPRDVFAARAAALDARMPQLAAHEIIVEMQRIVALVGDGHTNINMAAGTGVDFHQLPLRIGRFRDGYWVEAADRAYANAVGARVVAIGGVPVDSAVARITPLVSRDNDAWIDAALPHLVNLVEVLHALRLTNSLERAVFTLEKEGRRFDVQVAPLAATRPRAFGYPFQPRYTGSWVDARDGAAAPVPLYQQRHEQLYFYEYLPRERVLYIKFDQVANRQQGETALQVMRSALQLARDSAARIDRVLLDLRNNTGGEGGLLDPIVREFVRTREVDEPGRFFVAIGPRTFSAALLLSSALERYARPTFVGMPTGGRPNVYAGHAFATLPNSGIAFAISPALYQTAMPQDERQYIVPRLAVQPEFADYAANRDPVLQAVIDYRGDNTAALRAMILQGDTAGAARWLRDYDAAPINRYNGSATAANTLGYTLLREGNTAAALNVLRVNVRVHDGYANGWDSLAEVAEQAGLVAEARAAAMKLQQLEPANMRARDFLHRLNGR